MNGPACWSAVGSGLMLMLRASWALHWASRQPQTLPMMKKSVSSITWTQDFKSSVIEIWRWNLSSKGKASWSWQPVLLPLQLEATWQVAVERKEHGPTKGVFATVLQDSFSGPGSGPSLKRSGEMRITVLEMKKQHQEGCTLSGGKQSHRATIFNWQMWPSDGVFGQDLNLVLAAEGKAGFLGRASRG